MDQTTEEQVLEQMNTRSLLGTLSQINVKNRSDSTDFEDNLFDQAKKIRDAAKESPAMKDSYGNSLLSIGNDDKTSQFDNYKLTWETLNWPLWTCLYNDSWVFKRAIDKPAQDMVRAGINLEGSFDRKEDVLRMLKKHRTDFIQLLQWGNLYGGSIAFMMFDNLRDEDYQNPINYSVLRASKVMTMYVVDRWYGVAPTYDQTVTSMNDIDFGKPKYYNITLADGHTILVHHDYVLRYEGRTAPKFIKNGMLQGWGYAEGSHIMRELSRDEKLKNSIQSLIDKSLIEVIKMAGMRGVFMGTDAANQDQLRKRLEMVNWGRGFNSLTFLDKEDEYQMNSFSGLTGLADILQQNMWQIAAALEMQGVLFGDLKSGLSNDTDALERYDETILGRCETYLRPIYEKFLKMYYKIYGVDESVEFTFNSLLISKKDNERMESIKSFTDLAKTLLESGVIDTRLFARAFQTYTTKGVIDFGLTDEVIDKLDDVFNQQMEGLSV